MVALILVHLDVNVQIGSGLEGLGADFASERPHVRVHALAVHDKRRQMSESFGAAFDLTREDLLAILLWWFDIFWRRSNIFMLAFFLITGD